MPIDNDECVYCDIQLTLEQGVEMLELLKKVRAAGEHPALDNTLDWMERQIRDSIESATDEDPKWGKPRPKH